MIPWQIIVDIAFIIVAVIIDRRMNYGNALSGHPLPAAMMVFAILLFILTIIVVVVSITLTISDYLKAEKQMDTECFEHDNYPENSYTNPLPVASEPKYKSPIRPFLFLTPIPIQIGIDIWLLKLIYRLEFVNYDSADFFFFPVLTLLAGAILLVITIAVTLLSFVLMLKGLRQRSTNNTQKAEYISSGFSNSP